MKSSSSDRLVGLLISGKPSSLTNVKLFLMSKSLDPLRREERVSRKKIGIHKDTDLVISAKVVSLSLSRRSMHSGSRNSDTSTAMNLLQS